MADFDSFIPALHKPSSLLPIARHRDALLYTIEQNPVTIIIGQTGSGKTTQLPQYLEQAGWCNDGKIVAVTQASMPISPPIAIMIDSSLQIPSSRVEWL
jgi:ATP-dependent RNA helicase DDX35